ncbi:mitochondrial cardiolipin hydrolase-like [Bradysia coprophila]|uniref:mitochondrial cardiolipin hydrolase-like n=1 Tax=Bradysia coprophila TaxID=38358 RepID=UPI00187DC8DD|nr:mitochondrial cardiolipin hydrolase-like [Bradysia coprophila]
MMEKLTVNNLSSHLFKYNALLVGTVFLMWLYKQHANRKKHSEIDELLFMKRTDCCKRENNCDNEHCYNYVFQRMKSLIDGAQYSVYVCMNIFTSASLGEVVLRAHQRGVLVKIIANYSTEYASGSQITMLHINGIPVKQPKTHGHMHHKFCLIDTDKSTKKIVVPGALRIPSNGVVMTGSMNWTFQAMDQNWENLRITSDKFFVEKFHNEFNAIWNNANVDDFRRQSGSKGGINQQRN